jgi:hypothetical protein
MRRREGECVSGGIQRSAAKREGCEDGGVKGGILCSVELLQLAVFTGLILPLPTQPLGWKLCCRWCVFELEHQVFELQAAKNRGGKGDVQQQSFLSLFIKRENSRILLPLWTFFLHWKF